MKKLKASATFTHIQLGSVDKGQEFECETKLANQLIKDNLATEVKATEDKN